MTDVPVAAPKVGGVAPNAASGELWPAAPPAPRDIMQALGSAHRQAVDELPGKVLDPAIQPRDRLLVGAQVFAGKQGADLDRYDEWVSQRAAVPGLPTPVRAGISERQALVLAQPDDRTAQAKVLAPGASDVQAARIGAWVDGYQAATRPAAVVDVARFDRAVDDGVIGGRARQMFKEMLAGRLEDADVAELDSAVGRFARAVDALDDDFTVGGNGKLIAADVDQDVRLRVRFEPDDSEPVSAPGALQALPGDWLPQSSLKGAADVGFDLYIGEADAVMIAPSEQTEHVDAVYRRGFPAVVGPASSTRWMSARPTVLRDPGVLRDAAQRNPTAELDTHLSTYPGLLPYDSIVFELDAPSPRLAELGAVRLGRGIAEGSALSGRVIAAADVLDAEVAADAVASTMWAIFPDGADVKLAPRFEPIPVHAGKRTGRLVFGITPNEAAEVAPFAFVNDGIATRFDDYDDLADAEDEAGLVQWQMPTRDGAGFTFAMSLDESPLVVERRARPVDRWHLPLDERGRPRVSGLADHLELNGAKNLVAYVSSPTVAGFERAREHVYGDGGRGFHVARTADLAVGDSNGLPVWVRSAAGLPSRWLRLPADALDTRVEEMTATQHRDRMLWTVDARGLDDVGPQVRQAHALAQKYGYEAVEVLGDDGPIRLAAPRRTGGDW